MTQIKVTKPKLDNGRLVVIPKWGGVRYYCAIAQAITGKREIIRGELQYDQNYDYKVYYSVPRDLLQPAKLLECGTFFKNAKGKEVFQPFLIGLILNVNEDHIEVLTRGGV